jgi:predicted ATPase
VKCHFDATEADIRKTFPEFNFVEVENYNKGSFSLVFNNKEEAKKFVEATRNVV